jgi:hypothetical protein
VLVTTYREGDVTFRQVTRVPICSKQRRRCFGTKKRFFLYLFLIVRNEIFVGFQDSSTAARVIIYLDFFVKIDRMATIGVPMSLIQYVRPLLELGICKEYSMPRKTTENTTPKRSKKTATAVEPPAVEAASQVKNDVPSIVSGTGPTLVRKDERKSGSTASVTRIDLANVNVEEEIRRRAYELYLQRRATAGSENGNGDENQDWLVAEREILSRFGNREQRSA